MAVKTYSLKADGNTYLSKSFQVKEFRCQDGSDKILIDDGLVNSLQKIRDYFGKPITITSAYRNARHNANVGGASNSQHLYGTAADISISGVTPTLVAQYAQFIGMKGIGDYDRASGYFTHVDMRASGKQFWKQINGRYNGVATHGGQDKFKEEEVEIRDITIKHKEKGLVPMKAVNVNGENYVRLRDVEKIAPIVVDWDGTNPTVESNYKE